jgi:hypothetical protein
MNVSASRYADWKAPADDRQLLIWPPPHELLHDARTNHARLARSHHVLIQKIPLPELRRKMRAWLGHESDEQPLLATGHQTELEHAGVWVKNVLINVAAAKLEGRAVHFAVDTDAPKHLHLRWPGEAMPITDDRRLNTAAWAGLLDPPSPRHLQEIERRLRESSRDWSFTPVLPSILASLRRLTLESLSFPAALLNAVHELEWEMGLRHHALTTSPIWSSEPMLTFAHHLLADAPEFATHYNLALADYRRESGSRNPNRPMPDLFVSDQSIEAPFWMDDLRRSRRSRPSVFKTDEGWALQLPNGERFTFRREAEGLSAAAKLAKWLNANHVRLAPRALTLTMFLRLSAADQFVHGIGGGRYDQVTDRIIASYFRLDPPRFAVTTATMLLPLALEQTRICLPCVVSEGHHLRHRLLGERKMQYVERIASLPRKSPQRRELFTQMHRDLSAAAATHPTLSRWEQTLRETQQRELEEKTLFDRELFFALQPRERLEGMIEQYHALFG